MLYNGELFWPNDNVKFTYPTIQSNAQCDVLIIGGGMSGSLCAYRMAEAGYQTILVDANQVGMMSTAANTGLLQFMSDKSLTDCIRDFGAVKAYHFYRQSYEGLNDIKKISRLLPNDFSVKERDSVFYPSKKKDEKDLKEEYINLRKYGFPCELLGSSEMLHYEMKKNIGLLTRYDAEINPYQFVQHLLDYAVQQFGLKIFEQSKLTHYSAGSEIDALINSNHSIKAKYMIYAGGYADNVFTRPIKSKQLMNTYVIVTKPLQNPLASQAMYWETARPYLYFRTTKDHRMIIGGLDQPSKNIPGTSVIHKKSLQLKRSFEQLFKQHPIEIDVSYGARFAETKDGLPFIGPHPKHGNILYMLGYGGNGSVYSSFGSQLLLQYIRGKNEPLNDIYLPFR